MKRMGNSNMNRIFKLTTLACRLWLTICQQSSVVVLSTLLITLPVKASQNVLRIGAIAGPETELLEVARQIALEKCHLKVEIVEFNDYVMPNISLSEGSTDANLFQHQPYLDAMMKNRHLGLVSIGRVFIYPMGLYSKRIKQLHNLPEKATVALPNDPSNEARALLLLQKAGLIKLRRGGSPTSDINDITVNPKNLQFRLLDAALLPRVLEEVDLAAINTNYALLINLLPQRDALVQEDTNSQYANLLVVRFKQREDTRFVCLIDALHSERVKEKAAQLFKGAAVKGW